MPRSITRFDTGPGFALYQLGKREAFTVEAFSTLASAPTGPDDDNDLFLDYLNSVGDVIYRQSLGSVHQPPVFYSLTPNAEPMENLYGQAVAQWPQVDGVNGPALATLRLSPITLNGGCTVRVYACFGSADPATDPFSSLDPTYVFAPHMWVEDVATARSLPPPPPPLLAHAV
jgi:hypothetical protein